MLTVKRERELEEGINKRLSRKLDRQWKKSIVVRPPPSLKKLQEEEAAAEAEKSAWAIYIHFANNCFHCFKWKLLKSLQICWLKQFLCVMFCIVGLFLFPYNIFNFYSHETNLRKCLFYSNWISVATTSSDFNYKFSHKVCSADLWFSLDVIALSFDEAL